MSISRILGLSAGLFLTVSVVSVVSQTILVRRMLSDLTQLAEVEEPLEQAILEMEINVGETARAVLDYIRDHEESDLERLRDSESDFQLYARQFERLAETEEERILGQEVAELHLEFTALGSEITRLSALRRESLLTFRRDAYAIDELIDESLQPSIDRSADDALTKLEAALDMEVNIDEAFAAIEGYVLEPSAELRLRIADSEADFARFEAQYRTTRMSADEERWLDVINAAFIDAVATGVEIVSLTDRLSVALERFEANLEETDRILDEEIQPLILSETERAVVDARLSGNITLGATVALGLLMLLGAVGMTRLVMVQRAMETSLAESERSLRATLDSVGDAVISTDTQGRVAHLNPVAQELTGWTVAEADGRPLTEVFRTVHAHTRTPVLGPVGRVLETRETVRGQDHTLLISKDGTERPIDDSASPIQSPDAVVTGVVIVFRDVSEARQMEGRLRQRVRRNRLTGHNRDTR